MNTKPSPDDNALRDLLHNWQVESRDNPALARRVWARIEAERPGAGAAWLEMLARLVARPAAAFAAVALFAALGAVAATVQDSHRRDTQVSRLAAEYARSIDPILMTNPADHVGHLP